MALQVDRPGPDRLHIGSPQPVLGNAAVRLEGAYGGHDHRRVRLEAGLAALDVEELLGPQVGPETGLGHHVVGQLQGALGGDYRVAAVGDVGEGAAVNEGGVVLQGLHQVGGQGVAQQDRHRPRRLQILRQDGPLVARVGHHDLAEAFGQVLQIGRQAEDRHDFRGHHDVEAVFAGKAVGRAAQGRGDLAQGAVVHVDHPAPGDAALVDAEGVAPVDMVVDQGREQVVRDADGMEVAGEMEIDVLHGHDLRIAAAGRPALHPEAGTERGLAQADRGLLADPVETVAEAHGGGGLALPRRRRIDRGHQDQLAVGAILQRLEKVERHLRLVRTVGEQAVRRNVELRADLRDRLQGGFTCDLDVAFRHDASGLPASVSKGCLPAPATHGAGSGSLGR